MNSASGRFTGPVVQAGTVHGNVQLNYGWPATSHYWSQVERIAPSELINRAEELAELAEFCTSSRDSECYAWWRADAWSGKSALLSSFALAPPKGIRVVPFFVTASLGRQSNRQALVENILEQLWALLGQSVESHLTETTRESRMLDLLERCAHRCWDQGERLVLVVDGLDEDRGWDGTPDAHSIAAILPSTPPWGMRVIVSGRPNPSLPNDVPDDHPLRRTSIIRTLAPSAQAQVVRDTMERDLKRLLHGSTLEQDLIGLLTAAGGGLTTSDLAELIGTSEWQVEDHLQTAAGRSFRRTSENAGGASEVHVLAHEQLQVTAQSMLGRKLTNYTSRIHTWADGYAASCWPTDTPEFLFRGYFTMLVNSGDVGRVMSCATDPYRHQFGLVCTGGDGAALAEIITAQNIILSEDEPDLVRLARLAIHRVRLQRRNSQIPTSLPAGWARLHEFDRAESMIGAIRDRAYRMDALRRTATVCHREEQPVQANKLLNQAEDHANTISQFWTTAPILWVASASALVGDHDRVARLIEIIKNSTERTKTLALLAGQVADADEHDRAWNLLSQAETALCSSKNSEFQAEAQSALAVAAKKLGDFERSRSFLASAVAALQGESSDEEPIGAGTVAEDAAVVGDYDCAFRLVDLIGEPERREKWLRVVVSITAAGGEEDRAEEVARTTSNPAQLSRRLSEVAKEVSHAERANRLIAESKYLAQQEPDRSQRGKAFVSVAAALASTGDLEQAISMAHAYAEDGADAQGIISIAAAVIRAGYLEYGAELLQLTENVARRMVDDADEHRLLLWIRTVVDFRDFDRAEQLAKALHDSAARSNAWAVIAEGALAIQDVVRAGNALAAVDGASPLRRVMQIDLIRATLSIGESLRAESVADSADNPTNRTLALLLVAQETRNENLFDKIERSVEAIESLPERVRVLLNIVEAAAGLHFRTRTTKLLGQLEIAAGAVAKEPNAKEMDIHTAERVTKFCSTRVRTLTEVAEKAKELNSFGSLPRFGERLDSIVPGQPFDIRTEDPPEHKKLAYEVSERDWCYVMGDLVVACPGAYSAVTAELDVVESYDETC